MNSTDKNTLQRDTAHLNSEYQKYRLKGSKISYEGDSDSMVMAERIVVITIRVMVMINTNEGMEVHHK